MNLAEKKCAPCEGKTGPLIDNAEDELLKEVPSWQFVNRIASIAENEQHHPDICISYKKVTIELWTHAINGLSENDFILAAKIDMIVKQHPEISLSPDWSI